MRARPTPEEIEAAAREACRPLARSVTVVGREDRPEPPTAPQEARMSVLEPRPVRVGRLAEAVAAAPVPAVAFVAGGAVGFLLGLGVALP